MNFIKINIYINRIDMYNLIILYSADRPLPPEGPLDVSEVTRESVVLSWKPPKDDGGCPIKHYLVEKMDASRATWMEAGEATGLSFKVTRLIHHKKYQFRVIAVNEIGDSDPLETTDGVTAKDPFGKFCDNI